MLGELEEQTLKFWVMSLVASYLFSTVLTFLETLAEFYGKAAPEAEQVANVFSNAAANTAVLHRERPVPQFLTQA